MLEAEIAKIAERGTAEVAKRDKAASEIAHLLLASEIPTDASIARARKDRETTWQAIRDRYLSDEGADVASRPLADRKADIDQHRQQSEQADRLADQKSLEAERLVALDLAQRQKAEALIAIESLEQQGRALDERRRKGVQSWEEAWPEAVSRQSDLGRLKALAEERATILDHNARVRELIEDVEQHRAEMAPQLWSLAEAEEKFAVETRGTASIVWSVWPPRRKRSKSTRMPMPIFGATARRSAMCLSGGRARRPRSMRFRRPAPSGAPSGRQRSRH